MSDQLYKLEFSIESDLSGIGKVEDNLNMLQELFADDIASYSIFEKQEHVSWDISILFYKEPDKEMLENIFKQLDIVPEYKLSKQAEVNWLKKNREEFAPFTIGSYFIYGSFDKDNINVPEGSYPIQIDAATAFGSGRHETTKGCIMALDEVLSAQEKENNSHNNIKHALDLGCGSGILAIAIAKKMQDKTSISAIDNDQEAIKVARDNFAINQVSDFIIPIVGDGLSATPDDKKFDLIVANILAVPLINMSRDISRHLEKSSDHHLSRLILSGILNEQAPEVIHTYQNCGLNLLEHKKLGDWSTIIFTKP